MGQYILDYGTHGQRILNAFGDGYQSEIDGQPNPQTKSEYAEQRFKQYIKDFVVQYEARQAATQAREDSIQNSDFDISIS